MSVQTCVWMPTTITFRDGHVLRSIGHAAVFVGPEYLSFWPAGNVTFNLKEAASSVPSTFHKYADDRDAEKHDKDLTVTLNGLDEDRMLFFLRRMKTVKPNYDAKNFNCTHPVKIALYEGSNRKPPNFHVYAAKSVYHLGSIWPPELEDWVRETWNPLDLHRYAQFLKTAGL